MTRDADWNSPELVEKYKNPEWSDLDAIMRDIIAVSGIETSEVRARIEAYAKNLVSEERYKVVKEFAVAIGIK